MSSRRGVPRARFSSPQSQTRSSLPRSSSRSWGAIASYSHRAATASTRTALGRRAVCTARACACCAVRVRVHVHVACARVGTAWARRALYSADAARRLDPDRAAHRAPPSVRAAARTCGGRLERRDPSAAPCLLGQLHAAARGLRLRAPLCRPLVRTHRCATRALPRAPSCSHETTHRERQRWRRRRRRRRRRRAKLAASEDGDGVANPGWPRDGHTRPCLTEQTPPPREKIGGGQGGTSP